MSEPVSEAAVRNTHLFAKEFKRTILCLYATPPLTVLCVATNLFDRVVIYEKDRDIATAVRALIHIPWWEPNSTGGSDSETKKTPATAGFESWCELRKQSKLYRYTDEATELSSWKAASQYLAKVVCWYGDPIVHGPGNDDECLLLTTATATIPFKGPVFTWATAAPGGGGGGDYASLPLKHTKGRENKEKQLWVGKAWEKKLHPEPTGAALLPQPMYPGPHNSSTATRPPMKQQTLFFFPSKAF